MISLEKWKILRPLQKLPNNVGDLAKLMVAKGFKKLPKVQKIAKSGHTGRNRLTNQNTFIYPNTGNTGGSGCCCADGRAVASKSRDLRF